jgi:hypothetical protein
MPAFFPQRHAAIVKNTTPLGGADKTHQTWRPGFAYGRDEADPVGVKTTGHEPEHVRRFNVEPVPVVDDAQQRLLFSRPGKQRQCGEPHQEKIRRRPFSQAERDLHGIALRHRQCRQQ